MLARHRNEGYEETVFDSVFLPEEVAYTIENSELFRERLLNRPPNGKALFPSRKRDTLLITPIGNSLLEISFNYDAWVFVLDEIPDVPLGEDVARMLRDFEERLALEQRECEQEAGTVDPNSLDGLPDWWTDEDTKEFLDRLGDKLKEELDPREQIEDFVLERIVEEVAADILADMLAKREATRAIEELIRRGKTHEEAERIARRFERRVREQYRYRRPKLLQRFNPLRKLAGLRKLLKSPKAWLRGRIARALIKGLGKRLLGILGLIDDLKTIFEALYLWWKASEAWEGAREAERQAHKLECELEQFRRNLTPDERQRLEELFEREREYFERMRERHRARGERQINPVPDVQP